MIKQTVVHDNKNKKDTATTTKKRQQRKSKFGLLYRPPNSIWTIKEYASYNNTGKWVGWDYGPFMPNAFVPPIITLFYFIPEIRTAMMMMMNKHHHGFSQSQESTNYYNNKTGNTIKDGKLQK